MATAKPSADAKPATDKAHELKDELNPLRKDLSNLMDTVKAMGKDQAESAVHSAKEAVDRAAEKVRTTTSEARKKGEVAAEELEAVILRHPLTSIFVALGLGYVFGRARH